MSVVEEEVEQQPELTPEHVMRLRGDAEAHAKLCLKIQTKRARLEPLDFNESQRIVNAKIEEQWSETGRIRVLILKARQKGMSTFVGARIYRGCTLWGHRRGMVVADKVDRSAEIFSIYERFNEHCALHPPMTAAMKRRELAYSTGSRITVETAGDADVGRASTVYYLHGSEVAFWPNPEQSWLSLAQAVPSDTGEVYLESTANGVGGLFHAMWISAPDNGWLPIFLPWWVDSEYELEPSEREEELLAHSTDEFERRALDVGIFWEGELHKLTFRKLAWRRRKINEDFLGDERAFRQEFPATADEAFLVSGNAFFDEEALQLAFQKARPPLSRGNLIRVGGGIVYRRAERGFLKIWEMPRPDGHYVIGADTATGARSSIREVALNEHDAERGGRDYSVAAVMEVSTRQIVAMYHGRIKPDVFAEGTWNLGFFYRCGPVNKTPALLAPENNHESGKTVLRWLRNHNYPRIYIHRRYSQRSERVSQSLGWVTDGSTRMPMLDELEALVREGEIGLPDKDILREMSTFVRGDGERPEAQEGAHDDRVMAVGIANQMRQHHTHGAAGALAPVEVSDSPTGW